MIQRATTSPKHSVTSRRWSKPLLLIADLRHRFGPSSIGVLRTAIAGAVLAIGVLLLRGAWPTATPPTHHLPADAWTVPFVGEWRPLDTSPFGRVFAFRDPDPVPQPFSDRDADGFDLPPFGTDPNPIEPRPLPEDDDSEGTAGDRSSREYTVKRNDSFWRIAERELGSGLRHEEILEWNPKLRGRTLHAGMKIQLPGDGASGEERPRPPVDSTHTVREGENLTRIAGQYSLTPERLFEANREGLRSPDLLRVGQTLVIPGGGAR